MKYYAVRYGLEGPKVYTDWTSCQNAVKGFKGAKFKSFTNQEDADAFIDLVEEVLINIPENGIFVDGASSIKNDTWEYRLVFSDGVEIYRSPVYKGGTNNTGEFLAIVKALQLCKENDWNYTIYSDSVCGISWVTNKLVNSKSLNTSDNTNKMLAEAINWLVENDNFNKIVHWNSKVLNKQIFADYNRK